MNATFRTNMIHLAALAAFSAVCSAPLVSAQMTRVSMTMPDGGGAVLLSPPTEEPQVKDELMEGLEKLGANAKERNEVNLDKNMMALAGGRRSGRYADLSQKMEFIVVRNYEFASKGQYQRADLDNLRKKLEGSGWSHLVRNESDGEVNDIVVKAGSDGLISDMVILNAEPKELNIVHMRGHFKMEDVNGAMGSAMGIGAGAFGVAEGLGRSTSHSESHSETRSSRSSSSTAPAPPAPPSPAAPASPPSR